MQHQPRIAFGREQPDVPSLTASSNRSRYGTRSRGAAGASAFSSNSNRAASLEETKRQLIRDQTNPTCKITGASASRGLLGVIKAEH